MSKTRKNKSKWKIQRRLGLELPGLGRPGALSKRSYAPGDHGAARKRSTDYGMRLEEKQKLMFHYGLREQQMRHFIKRAKKHSKAFWLEAFFTFLESRLDNIVFRLGFAASIPAARQMVRHGKVLLKEKGASDAKKITIPSYIVNEGAEISLVDSFYELNVYIQTRQKPRLELPSYLNLKADKKKDIGELIALPGSAHIPFAIEKRYIAEFYTKVKP